MNMRVDIVLNETGRRVSGLNITEPISAEVLLMNNGSNKLGATDLIYNGSPVFSEESPLSNVFWNYAQRDELQGDAITEPKKINIVSIDRDLCKITYDFLSDNFSDVLSEFGEIQSHSSPRKFRATLHVNSCHNFDAVLRVVRGLNED